MGKFKRNLQQTGYMLLLPKLERNESYAYTKSGCVSLILFLTSVGSYALALLLLIQ